MAAPLSRSPGFGASLAWFPQGRRFAVGDPDAGLAQVYDLEDDGGVTLVAQFQDPAIPGFGRSVAVGDLSPREGLEVVVASRGRVSTFQLDGGLVFRIPGLSNSLGAALAVSPGYAAGLDSLWVGEPALGRVIHYVGDSGTVTNKPGIAFGSSLAVDDRRGVAAGAPAWPGGDAGPGALFFEQLGGPVAGVAMECTAGASCATRACELGDCLGGVLCRNLLSECTAGETCDSTGACVPDAGVRDGGIDGGADAGIDAGAVDAGAADAGGADAGGADAGAADAGATDAGATDAGAADAGAADAGRGDAGAGGDAGVDPAADGPLIFGTCGCSGGAMPALLLCLMLLRRQLSRPPSRH
mgnify:FL=1